MNQPIIFVPYNIALLAKQKGFDEPCVAYYWKDVLTTTCNQEEDDYWHINSKLAANEIAAPTYQQLVDWLREKHNTVIYARPYLSGVGNTEYFGVVHGVGEYLTEFPVKPGYYEAFDHTLERVLKELK
jgi:hypothetical protein